jgi:hypothetical protein
MQTEGVSTRIMALRILNWSFIGRSVLPDFLQRKRCRRVSLVQLSKPANSKNGLLSQPPNETRLHCMSLHDTHAVSIPIPGNTSQRVVSRTILPSQNDTTGYFDGWRLPRVLVPRC